MVEINNLTRSRIDEVFVRRVAKRVLEREHKTGTGLSIVFVGQKRSTELNRKYRKEDRAANVLSFPGEGEELGEVILCPVQIKQDARTYGMIFEQALAWMLIHGILHLLGYGHERAGEAKRMEQKEHGYLSRIKNRNAT